MLFNHVTPDLREKILKAADATAELVTGCRNRLKLLDSTEINLTRKYSRKCEKSLEKLPKSFGIVYFQTLNLGTSKYPDTTITAYPFNFDSKVYKLRETEKSLIIEADWTKLVINKDKILCLVY